MPDQKTFVVLGNYRGGTTMIAGILMALGVHMGDPSTMRIHREDRDFWQQPCHVVQSLIRFRNQQHDVWGWKDPAVVNFVERLHLRNPHYIAIFRDPLAVAKSEEARADTIHFPNKFTTLEDAMQRVIETDQKILDFIHTHQTFHPGAHAFMTSYEHWIRFTVSELTRLKDFLDVPMSREQFLDACDSINFDAGFYVPVEGGA